MSGKFFVFDGMDGSGKSTALTGIAAALSARGHQVLCTREPGGNPLAEEIRACMLADRAVGMPVETELLLVFAARAAHLQQTVLPALQAGQIVLCDRFVDSSHVYQGTLGGVDAQWIEELTARTVSRAPDQIFIFDLPVERAMQRMQQRRHSDRFDRQNAAALQRMRDAYRARAELPSRRLVDAEPNAESVMQNLLRTIEGLL